MKEKASFLLMERLLSVIQEARVYESDARSAINGVMAFLPDLGLPVKPTADYRGAVRSAPRPVLPTVREAPVQPLRPA